MPPLAGRITQLKVQLGERVDVGPAARRPRTRLTSAPPTPTTIAPRCCWRSRCKNRDRQRELAKIGGAAAKDLQQTETDYVTAEVEHQRADARLRQIGVDPETTDQVAHGDGHGADGGQRDRSGGGAPARTGTMQTPP